MSVPLREEKRSEAPLITFTLCVPAAVGIVVLSMVFALLAWFGSSGGRLLQPGLLLALVGGSALLLTVAGMLASMAHLAKPIRAPFSLRHLQSSWLSREIAAVALFGACVVVWVGGALLSVALCALAGLLSAAISGIALLFVIARAYKVPTRPAWSGIECSIELISSACGSGAAVFLLCLSIYEGFEVGGVLQRTAGCNGFGVIACIVLACAFMVIGFGLGAYAHKSRFRRLLSIREESDERVALTLENYRSLEPVICKAWRIELVATVIGIAGGCLCAVAFISGESAFALAIGAMVLCSMATVLELTAHGMQRWLFYEIPVPVRYVALLRK